MDTIYVAMGCFWGVEKLMRSASGVLETAVGYMGGDNAQWPHPTYEQVCSGRTGHAETVQVRYDPQVLPSQELLRLFWENHDPTTPDRQGNDLGSQYRSALWWTTEEQRLAIDATRAQFGQALSGNGYGPIITEVGPAQQAGPFHSAEQYHQRYLEKNPAGYCPIHATGVRCE